MILVRSILFRSFCSGESEGMELEGKGIGANPVSFKQVRAVSRDEAQLTGIAFLASQMH